MKDVTNDRWLDHYYRTTDLHQIFDKDVLSVARILNYQDGDLLCEAGDRMTQLLFLVEGAVKVFTTLDNGRAYLLRIEEPLQVYGEAEVLFDGIYIANVEALPGCRCIGVPIAYIHNHHMNRPQFLRFIIGSLAGRLDRISQMSTANLLLPLKSKVASFLAAHMDEKGEISIRVSYQSVSDQLGCTYRHLSRTLKTFEEQGIIKKQGKIISVIDEAALTAIAGDTYRY